MRFLACSRLILQMKGDLVKIGDMGVSFFEGTPNPAYIYADREHRYKEILKEQVGEAFDVGLLGVLLDHLITKGTVPDWQWFPSIVTALFRLLQLAMVTPLVPDKR